MSLEADRVESMSWEIAPRADACHKARVHLEGWLEGLEPELRKTLVLLASELTLLAMDGDPAASGASVEFVAARDATCVRLEAVRPAARYAFAHAVSDVRDMALYLVDQLADRWGVRRTGRGTAWWVELDRWPL